MKTQQEFLEEQTIIRNKIIQAIARINNNEIVEDVLIELCKKDTPEMLEIMINIFESIINEKTE